MSVKQISIFLENKPGKMCEMTEVLAERGINMRGLSLAETEGFGIVRIIVDDVYAVCGFFLFSSPFIINPLVFLFGIIHCGHNGTFYGRVAST